MTRKLLVGALAVGALAVTTGTAVALSGQEDPTPTSSSVPTTPTSSFTTESSPTSTGSPTSTVPVDPLIGQDEAIRIARERVGGGDVTEVETELEHGRPEWKIELHANGVEHDVRVDARTGDITRVDSDDDNDGDRHDDTDDRDDRDDRYDDD